MAEEEITVPADETQVFSEPEAEAATAADVTEQDETDPQISRIRQLEQQVSELEAKLASESEHANDYMNRYQRTQADFANFKRRSQQEQEQHDALLAAQVISLFLPALDSFERAFATLPPSLLGYSWIDGISLVMMEMQRALQVHGVAPIEVRPGEAFDPSRHESVGEVESNEHPQGHVAVVLQPGYEVKGRTLRPTLVQLARPQAAAPAPADQTAGEGDSQE